MDNWNENSVKQPKGHSDPATQSAPRPGDYPLGSLESRAAARIMIDTKKREGDVIQVVFVSPDGRRADGPRIELPPA